MAESGAAGIRAAIAAAGVDLDAGDSLARPGIICFGEVTIDLVALLHEARRFGGPILALAASPNALRAGGAWRVLQAGAADALVWTDDGSVARQVRAKLDRWNEVDEFAAEGMRRIPLIGSGAVWIDLVRRAVEAGRFGDTPVLLIGESGTGKELLARLIHMVGARVARQTERPRDLVTVDCSTIVAELSGSEFFGHEKGAFTGAVSAREGAFAAADNGTLFLDEVGELPPSLQAQLLRAVQEKTYKRVGSNVWQTTNFRLISATNRNLAELVERGQFRLDLYYRLAGLVLRLPSLRERSEDILPLATHFLKAYLPGGVPLEFDEPVREYLVNRNYTGNIRELRQLILRIAHRHVGAGPITAGDIPPEDRPAAGELPRTWPDERLDRAIEDAIACGVELKKIRQAATETAIRIAMQSEKGIVHRAAQRLGVSDRALQLRRAQKKAAS